MGVRAHLVASQLAVPLRRLRRRGLIVSTTANVAASPYMPNTFYDLAKHAVARMVWAMAGEYGFTDVDGTQPPPLRVPPARKA